MLVGVDGKDETSSSWKKTKMLFLVLVSQMK